MAKQLQPLGGRGNLDGPAGTEVKASGCDKSSELEHKRPDPDRKEKDGEIWNSLGRPEVQKSSQGKDGGCPRDLPLPADWQEGEPRTFYTLAFTQPSQTSESR